MLNIRHIKMFYNGKFYHTQLVKHRTNQNNIFKNSYGVNFLYKQHCIIIICGPGL